MEEDVKYKIKEFFKAHSESIPEEFKKYIDDDEFYNLDNTWVLVIMAIALGNNKCNYEKEGDLNV